MRESGIQLDQPPSVGNISSLGVVILTSDNAEGILEFPQDFVNIIGKRKEEKKDKQKHVEAVIFNVGTFLRVSTV